MTEISNWLKSILTESGYSVGNITLPDGNYITFENGTVLGFVLIYGTPDSLIETWRDSSAKVAQSAQFALRRAGSKAWNSYFVFLTEDNANYGQEIAIGVIEEDLIGARKIARAGVNSYEEVRLALMPLLRVQGAPRLEAVDMAAEIRLRTSELPTELVEAFLAGASEQRLSQLLEAN